jgi:hypothetical protein
MYRSRPVHVLLLSALLPGADFAFGGSRAQADQAVAVTVEDFGYIDTSGEPTDQAAIHQKRLQTFMSAFRRDVEADQQFHLVPLGCTPPCTMDGRTTDDRLRAASQAGARILIVGDIHKISTLIQTARAAAIDVASNRVVFEKLFTFRGDSDEAWHRAEAFVSEDIRAGLGGSLAAVPSVTPAPITLAMFDFELEDTSAAAESTGPTASDATALTDVTEAVRKLLTESGRYQLIDGRSASEKAAKTHGLHDCGGCDAAIAQGLGADQSLVGVIRRVSRTEYTIRFEIRDAKTGAVVANADSGLRMGANYSWSRGAVRLVRDRLLDNEPSPPL